MMAAWDRLEEDLAHRGQRQNGQRRDGWQVSKEGSEEGKSARSKRKSRERESERVESVFHLQGQERD